jgi:hypothetical protein
MQLDEIQSLWDIDSKIDNTAYDIESDKIPQLHSKYFKILNNEKLKLKQLQYKLKKLALEKYEFLQQGPDKETYKEKGWIFPTNNIILKGDIERYLEADQELIDLNYKIDYIKIKIEYLESIIDNLNRRSFNIKNSIDFLKFTHGG